MGTGSGGEEEMGRSGEEPSRGGLGLPGVSGAATGTCGSPAPCCTPAFRRSGSGVSARLQGQLPPLSNGTTAVPAPRGHGETP